MNINKPLIRNMSNSELINACDFGKCESELTDMQYLITELAKRLETANNQLKVYEEMCSTDQF